jgi:hypothetical protein
MKKSYLLSLSLAAVMAIPVVAQQNKPTNPPSDQPATQTAPAQTPDQQAQTAPTASGQEPLKYERHEGFWGRMNPFARKKYVNRQLDPVRGRVNELDELTAKNSKMIADVDSRATEGIRNAMGKANDADAHAVDAGNRATQAEQTAQAANTRITGVEQTVGKLDQYQTVTQAEIRFRPGQAALSKNAKEALDQMAATLITRRATSWKCKVSLLAAAARRSPTPATWPRWWCATWCSTMRYPYTGFTRWAWATPRWLLTTESCATPAADAWKSAC